MLTISLTPWDDAILKVPLIACTGSVRKTEVKFVNVLFLQLETTCSFQRLIICCRRQIHKKVLNQSSFSRLSNRSYLAIPASKRQDGGLCSLCFTLYISFNWRWIELHLSSHRINWKGKHVTHSRMNSESPQRKMSETFQRLFDMSVPMLLVRLLTMICYSISLVRLWQASWTNIM